MDDFTNLAELAQGSQSSPVIVIIEQHVLARTCILNILKRELAEFEIVEMASTNGLNWLSGRDIRLIALNIGDKQITAPSIEDSLALLAKFLPESVRCCVVKSRRRRDGFSCNATGSAAAFFRYRSRSKSRSPGYAWFLPVGSTDRYRSLGKMERRASRRYWNAPTRPSCWELARVTAPPGLCRRRRWSTLRHAKNMCSRRCSSVFPTS